MMWHYNYILTNYNEPLFDGLILFKIIPCDKTSTKNYVHVDKKPLKLYEFLDAIDNVIDILE